MTGLSAKRGKTLRRLGFAAAVLALAIGSPRESEARYASLVMDAETGEVLHAANESARNYPASLTKMMTLLLLFEAIDRGALKFETSIRMSERATRQPPSKMGLGAGETLTVREAILALIVKSANDVALAVAEKLAGNERNFALKMTARARELGMEQTTFRNASGLPHGSQMSSAEDMAILARYLILNEKQHYHFFATRSFQFRGTTVTSHNRILDDFPGADGLKTGYIRASGFNVVTSAERDGRRLIGIVFGGRSADARDQHMADLLDRAYAADAPAALAGVQPPPSRQKAWDVPGFGPAQPPSDVASAPVKPVDRAGDGLFPPKRGATREAALAPPVGIGDAVPGPDVTRAKKTPPRADADWGIQVGAYRAKHPAQESAEQAQKQNRASAYLEKGSIEIVPLDKPNRSRLYRARIMGLTKNEAHAACDALREVRLHCLELRKSDDNDGMVAVN